MTIKLDDDFVYRSRRLLEAQNNWVSQHGEYALTAANNGHTKIANHWLENGEALMKGEK